MFSKDPDYVVTVGDSLSDSGAVFDLTSALLVDPLALPIGPPLLDPGYAGVFSNGPVFTQLIAEAFEAGLTGYAVGGARVLGTQTLDGRFSGFVDFIDPAADPALFQFDANVPAQVARLVASGAPTPGGDLPAIGPDDTVLATALFGLNDLADLGSNLGNATSVGLQLLAAARELPLAIAASGVVDQIALYALPDAEFFPGGDMLTPEQEDTAELIVNLFNGALSLTALEVEATSDVEALVVRTDLLMEELDKDPAGYGFAAKGPFYGFQGIPGADDLVFSPTGGLVGLDIEPEPGVAGLSPDEVQFFDEVHFSAALHGIVAAFSEASFTKDVVFARGGNDVRLLFGGDGLVFGGTGRDTLYMLGGDDIGFGGAGADKLYGGLGDDLIGGGSGNDLVRGGAGDDLGFGGDGNDTIVGGTGDDTLLDGAGNDRVSAGAGDDVMIWIDPAFAGGPTTTDSFDGGRGDDTLFLVTDRDVDLGGRGFFDTLLGRWDLSEIGVTARSVENVVIVSGGPDALAPDLFAGNVTVPELYADAALWNLV